MGTEVLRPQDCLVERIRDSPCRRANYNHHYYYNPNPNFTTRLNRKQPVVQKKREPSISKRSISTDDVPKISRNQYHHRSTSASTNNHHLVMEKVTILRRGESFDSQMKSVESENKETVTDLRSPVAGQADVYAGSAFVVSPSPSDLPLPSFSKKKQISVDDSATRDLRRLLRLDF